MRRFIAIIVCGLLIFSGLTVISAKVPGASEKNDTKAPASILVVDGTSEHVSTGLIEQAMTDAGYTFDTWNVRTQGAPSFSYDIIVWDDGDDWDIDDDWVNNDDHSERTDNMTAFLNSGGRLYLCGANAARSLSESANPNHQTFLHTYLHATYISDDAAPTTAYGVVGDEISDGLSGTLNTAAGTGNQYPDVIEPYDFHADGIFYDGSGATGDCIGVKYEPPSKIYRTVLTSFVPSGYNSAGRAVLMNRIITWLCPPNDDDVRPDSIDSHADMGTYYSEAQDIRATVSNQGLNGRAPFDVRCVIYRLDYPGPGQTFLTENFEGAWGPRGGNPPSGWTIEDYGDMADGWNNNDWYNYDIDNLAVGAGPGNNVARVQWWNVELQDERLITPAMNFASYTGDIYLSFWHNYNDMSTNDMGSVDISLNGGTSWPITVVQYTTDVIEDARLDISSYVAGQSNVKIRWRYAALNDLWWMVDNVTVEYDPTPTLTEVYNETRLTGSLAPLESEQLTWNYDFPVLGEYVISIRTELAGDENPYNDIMDININIESPPPNDVRVDTIDSHVDHGTYPMGAQDILATVANPGSVSHSFNTRCRIFMQANIPPHEWINETFDHAGANPPGWTIQNDGTAGGWVPAIESGSDYYMEDNSDAAGNGFTQDDKLITPVLDFTGYSNNIYFQFWHDFRHYTGDNNAHVQISLNGGSTWPITVVEWLGVDDRTVLRQYDISTYVAGMSNVKIRWWYEAAFDWWWRIDDVKVYSPGSSGLIEVYNQTRTTGMLNQHDTEQLTWNYNFDVETDYIIEITTELSGDTNPINDQIVIDITIAGTTEFFNITLHLGWNLISLPLVQMDTSLDTILSGISGQWDRIYVYDSLDPDCWKSNSTAKPYGLNDLDSVTHKMGVWIHVTVPTSVLQIEGTLANPVTIPLYAGWNLVGYPTLTTGTTISVALAGTGYDQVQGYLASSPYVQTLAGSYVMTPGEGYWVHVPADTIWVVDW